jgi:hypothetical protein
MKFYCEHCNLSIAAHEIKHDRDLDPYWTSYVCPECGSWVRDEDGNIGFAHDEAYPR